MGRKKYEETKKQKNISFKVKDEDREELKKIVKSFKNSKNGKQDKTLV